MEFINQCPTLLNWRDIAVFCRQWVITSVEVISEELTYDWQNFKKGVAGWSGSKPTVAENSFNPRLLRKKSFFSSDERKTDKINSKK